MARALWPGMDPIGRQMRIGDETRPFLTVVGVAARGFDGTTVGSRPHVFVPLTMTAEMIRGWEPWENRRAYYFYLFARLRRPSPGAARSGGVTLDARRTGAGWTVDALGRFGG